MLHQLVVKLSMKFKKKKNINLGFRQTHASIMFMVKVMKTNCLSIQKQKKSSQHIQNTKISMQNWKKRMSFTLMNLYVWVIIQAALPSIACIIATVRANQNAKSLCLLKTMVITLISIKQVKQVIIRIISFCTLTGLIGWTTKLNQIYTRILKIEVTSQKKNQLKIKQIIRIHLKPRKQVQPW